ncbi:MAG: DNA (cytosine-5-)-methyltransferase [Treponema sp.]|jgi:DNA (cytosine-5)-methyltransferase 1|nr:DNA (cytosine-5-)-methyltransferase [Treponema sp.]
MIKYFDMFSGIGGFRAGFERAGGFECVGHCENDKYADASYRAVHNIEESEVYCNDARTINTETLPDFDLLCAGFPCQSFSIAGKRGGFFDPRGTLFFEIARVAGEKRPAYLLLENVPGLLSHDKGRTFAIVLDTLCELGYRCEWQVLDSQDFGVPQSRRRVYIVGYFDSRCAGEILPVRKADAKALTQSAGGHRSGRIRGGVKRCFVDLSAENARVTTRARCITARYTRGIGNRKAESSGVLLIREATKLGYAFARCGDGVKLDFPNSYVKHTRVGKKIAHTLNTGASQGVVTAYGRIRKLTPRECFRLQGFDEKRIDRLPAALSDAQLYKQAGNAVTVNVIHALGLRLKAAHERLLCEKPPQSSGIRTSEHDRVERNET